MKIIAISQRIVKNPDYQEIRDALDVRWAQLINQLGHLPLILPTLFDFRTYLENIKIDGIVLTGGNDLSCLSDDEISRLRDEHEKRVLRLAIEKSIPVLGVCRGMQLIADYFGMGFLKVTGHVAKRHDLAPAAGSRYLAAEDALDGVNSYHNYAVKAVSGDFLVSARSSDGVIEAMEHKQLPIFGQMWHPEREEPFRGADIDIIRRVVG